MHLELSWKGSQALIKDGYVAPFHAYGTRHTFPHFAFSIRVLLPTFPPIGELINMLYYSEWKQAINTYMLSSYSVSLILTLDSLCFTSYP